MSKTIRYDAVEVVISIPTEAGSSAIFGGGEIVRKKWDAGSVDSMNAAYRRVEEIVRAIKRSLGPYEDECRNPDIRIASEEVCSHCGYRWGEKSNTYNGGCCDEDQDAEDQRQAQVTGVE